MIDRHASLTGAWDEAGLAKSSTNVASPFSHGTPASFKNRTFGYIVEEVTHVIGIPTHSWSPARKTCPVNTVVYNHLES